MKSTVDKLDGLERKLNIEVPAEKVRDAFAKVYKGIQSQVSIKGFRKGKAPLQTIRSMYAEKVKQDVLQDLISESYQAALEEHALDPIGSPRIHFEAFEDNQGFHFSAEMEIRPQIQLNKYEGLSVEKEKLEIPDSRIDEVIENLRQRSADFVPVFDDRSLQEGDFAKIDFAGSINGEPMEHGTAEDYRLEIGSSSFIPGFEEGLVGMKVGETRTLNLQFPEDYHAEEIKGQPVNFEVKLKEISKKDLPELNDEFAKNIGPHQTMEEVKAAIRKEMEAEEAGRIQGELRDRLLNVLVQENPMETPQKIKGQQKARMVADVKQRLQQQGMPPEEFEDYTKKWNDEFEDSAEFMVKSSLLIGALADKLNLHATENQINTRIASHAMQSGIELERLREYYDNPDHRSSLAFKLTEENVLDHLIEKAEITEVAAEKLKKKEEA